MAPPFVAHIFAWTQSEVFIVTEILFFNWSIGCIVEVGVVEYSIAPTLFLTSSHVFTFIVMKFW